MTRSTVFVIETFPRRYWRADVRRDEEDVHAATPYTVAAARRTCREIKTRNARAGLAPLRFPRVVKVVTELVPLKTN